MEALMFMHVCFEILIRGSKTMLIHIIANAVPRASADGLAHSAHDKQRMTKSYRPTHPVSHSDLCLDHLN